MATKEEIRRFGIHKKTGVDIQAPKQKPDRYRLVEKVGNREEVIATAFRSQYAVLVAKKKKLMIQNPGFYGPGKNGQLIIEPII